MMLIPFFHNYSIFHNNEFTLLSFQKIINAVRSMDLVGSISWYTILLIIYQFCCVLHWRRFKLLNLQPKGIEFVLEVSLGYS